MSELDDSQFEDNKTRPKLTGKQKHKSGQRHKKVSEYLFSLTDISKDQLQTIPAMQEVKEMLNQGIINHSVS